MMWMSPSQPPLPSVPHCQIYVRHPQHRLDNEYTVKMLFIAYINSLQTLALEILLPASKAIIIDSYRLNMSRHCVEEHVA